MQYCIRHEADMRHKPLSGTCIHENFPHNYMQRNLVHRESIGSFVDSPRLENNYEK